MGGWGEPYRWSDVNVPIDADVVAEMKMGGWGGGGGPYRWSDVNVPIDVGVVAEVKMGGGGGGGALQVE